MAMETLKFDSLAYVYIYDVYFKPSGVVVTPDQPQEPVNIKIPTTKKLPVRDVRAMIQEVCDNEDDLDVDNIVHISVHVTVGNHEGEVWGGDGGEPVGLPSSKTAAAI